MVVYCRLSKRYPVAKKHVAENIPVQLLMFPAGCKTSNPGRGIHRPRGFHIPMFLCMSVEIFFFVICTCSVHLAPFDSPFLRYSRVFKYCGAHSRTYPLQLLLCVRLYTCPRFVFSSSHLLSSHYSLPPSQW